MTRGLPMLQGGRTKLEWDYHIKNRVNILEENLLRLTRLTEFGHYLSKMEGTGIFYNKGNKMFYMVGQNGKVANSAHEMVSCKIICKKNYVNTRLKYESVLFLGKQRTDHQCY